MVASVPMTTTLRFPASRRRDFRSGFDDADYFHARRRFDFDLVEAPMPLPCCRLSPAVSAP